MRLFRSAFALLSPFVLRFCVYFSLVAFGFVFLFALSFSPSLFARLLNASHASR